MPVVTIRGRLGSWAPEIGKANSLALKAGYNYGETTEMFTTHYNVKKAQLAPGKYRNIMGNEATAMETRP